MLWEDVLKWRFPDVTEERQTLIVKCCGEFRLEGLSFMFIHFTIIGPLWLLFVGFIFIFQKYLCAIYGFLLQYWFDNYSLFFLSMVSIFQLTSKLGCF